MTRIFSILAGAAMLAVLMLPIEARSAEQDGLRSSDAYEFSSRQRGDRSRHASRMHYYDPYPWWWYPPHVKRARTNYLGWPHSVYPPDYDLPYYGGVAGYPGGFWLMGL